MLFEMFALWISARGAPDVTSSRAVALPVLSGEQTEEEGSSPLEQLSEMPYIEIV